MDDQEVDKLFLKVAGRVVRPSPDVKNVFSILVSSTLRYRDWVKEEKGTVVTVEDVRVALDWLLETIRTYQMPKTENRLRLDLLNIWLYELRPYV
jgi:hypothetical protein